VEPAAVIADRIVGKPYLEIVPDRKAIARYGVPIRKFQDVIEIAIGGREVTTTIEGRERYPVRIRYPRELRDSVEALGRILVPGKGGQQIPITELAEIRYVRGPQVIKSEDTFLVGYVVFDKKPGYAEVDVVEQCQARLKEKLASGEFALPRGVSYRFAGSYENQIRATRTLAVILPVALFAIFLLIYFQFKDGCPHMQGVPHGAYGLFERGTGRIMTINCPGDIHCGWQNRFWSDGRNLEAIKMGINIIIYFLSH